MNPTKGTDKTFRDFLLKLLGKMEPGQRLPSTGFICQFLRDWEDTIECTLTMLQLEGLVEKRWNPVAQMLVYYPTVSLETTEENVKKEEKEGVPNSENRNEHEGTITGNDNNNTGFNTE